MNNDGTDEIIYVENSLDNPETYVMSNQLRVINLVEGTSYYLGTKRAGISMASSPGFIDLESDGKAEIIVATSSLGIDEGGKYSIIECIDLDKKIDTATWPGYLGPFENGTLK